LHFIRLHDILVDNKVMNGLTIDEMCKALNLPFKTVEARIQRAGIKPISRQAIYPQETLDIIRDVKMGRPPKQPEPEKPVSRGKAKPAKSKK
jgi:hypothetical protein